jgi:hypothetical protein
MRYPVLAALLLKTQNHAAYENLRSRLLASWSETNSFSVADQVAKACLFLPYSEADAKLIGHLADLPITNGASNQGALPYFQALKALSEYRQGHYSDAVQWGQEALSWPRNAVHPYASAILAMAYWKMGKKEEARAMLAKGDLLAPREMPASVAENSGDSWLAWLYARIHLDEASALIQPASATDNNPTPP